MVSWDVRTCDRLLGDEAIPLLDAVSAMADVEAPVPSAIERLRRIGPAELVPAALELVAARRRARRKIEGADRLLCDREGVEQASGTAVARHKALRFARAGLGRVVDVCSGIGGDAIELARAGLEVLAIEADPVRARMTRHNAACEVRIGDAATPSLADSGAAVHVDPARRVERGGARRARRLWRLEDLEPPVDVVERWLAGRSGAWKLGPGVDLDAVPAADERELEIVGDRRGLFQCVVWTGALASAPGARTATRLDGCGDVLTFTGRIGPEVPVARDIGRWLVVPDAALERAGLVSARLTGSDHAELAPGLGLLTGDHAIEDPWFESHHVLATMSWRERRISAWLRERDAGEVVVRTRGGAVDAERSARVFGGGGERRFVVFGVRLGRRVVAVITG